ncbi:MAG: nicotinate-nucleotide adenylyltransferase [Lachnospirales bacterium]
MKYGIMGGSFNPIHNGHLAMAQLIKEEYLLDDIIFIPTGNLVPHKEINVNPQNRLDMVKLATNCQISHIEINRNSTTYTIDTLKILKKIYLKSENDEFYYIIGLDTLRDIHLWKDIESLYKYTKLITVNRQGSLDDFLKIKKTLEKYKLHIKFYKDFNMNISSSYIRDLAKKGNNLEFFLPAKVAKYINENNLYVEEYDLDFITSAVKNTLSPKRFTHTLGVVETSVKLGKIYNVNLNSCKVAALLHDYCKEFSKEDIINSKEKYNLKFDSYFEKNDFITHGLLGKEIAKNIFNIENTHVLNAISHHTFGRANMNILEKIIYIADAIEPNRDYPDVNIIRKVLEEKGIDEAIKLEIELKMKYIGKDKMYYKCIEAYNYLE